MCWIGIAALIGLVGISSSYDISITHKYKYDTSVFVDEGCNTETLPQTVGQKLKAEVHLTTIWIDPEQPNTKLLKLELLNPKLLVPRKSKFQSYRSALDKIPSSVAYILRKNGHVTKIWENQKSEKSARNLIRGIASLFNFRSTTDQVSKEIDVSGSCDASYVIKGLNMEKKKWNCIHPKFDMKLAQQPGLRSVSTPHVETVNCELMEPNKMKISKCSVKEYIRAFNNIWSRPTICVDSKSELSLIGSAKQDIIPQKKDLQEMIKSLKDGQSGNLEESDLTAVYDEKKEKPINAAESLKKLTEGLKEKNLANVKSARAFYKLLPAFRASTSEEIKKILSNKQFNPVKNQIMDLVAASSTEDSIKAVLELYETQTEYDEQLERFLVSLSVSPRPQAFFLKRLKEFTEKQPREERIKATLISTLGNLMKTYAEDSSRVDMKILTEMRMYLEVGLKKCDSEDCQLMYLRGLRNFGSAYSVPLLFKHAQKGGKPALEAMFIIKSIDDRLLPLETDAELLKIFRQAGQRQDRSTRSLAAEILLRRRPRLDVLRSIVRTLSDQTDAEFSSYLAAKLGHLAEKDDALRSDIMSILSEKHISHYYSLAQKGASSLFVKPLMFAEGANSTYGYEMEMLGGGMLKRCSFDVDVQHLHGSSSLLSVGIFAQGLAALAGGDTAEEDEESSGPSAGIEISVLGSTLRPYIFFKSTSELMGHAWSGTASDPTPVLQGIFALSDEERLLVLGNGIPVRVETRGVLSIDASGSIKISLWSRNSQSVVKNAAALLVRSAVTIDSGVATTQGTFQFSGQTAIDFKTDAEFAESPFKICFEMEHPDIEIKYDVFRSQSIHGSTYQLKRSKKRTRNVPGKSFALHSSNNEMCKTMKASS